MVKPAKQTLVQPLHTNSIKTSASVVNFHPEPVKWITSCLFIDSVTELHDQSVFGWFIIFLMGFTSILVTANH